MGDNREEAESWYYSYDGWASQQREEARRKQQESLEKESSKFLDAQRPYDNGSSFMSQSFLTGEADLIEVEQLGQHITLKVSKGGLVGQVMRLNLNTKEARTLIMMLATAVEGGPFSQTGEDNNVNGFDF